MRTLAQIKDYVARQDQSHLSEITVVTRDIFTRVTTPQQFVAELQSKRNLTNHDDITYLQELKKQFNHIIAYANEEESVPESWETQEVIQWLINDESIWNELKGQSAKEVENWVKQGNAPDGLYQSFRQPPASSFNAVDWEKVAESLE